MCILCILYVEFVGGESGGHWEPGVCGKAMDLYTCATKPCPIVNASAGLCSDRCFF